MPFRTALRRTMNFYRRKRVLIELGHLEAWHRKGRGYVTQPVADFLRSLLEKGLMLSGLFNRGWRNAHCTVVTHQFAAFDTLPAEFHGFRILHLSDIHAGHSPELGERIGEKLRGLEVDLCLLTGDYCYEIGSAAEDVYSTLETIVTSISSRNGIVGILGNHDSIEMVRRLETMGVRMLVNEVFEVELGGEAVWLLGVDDPHYFGCDDLAGTLARVPDESFKILLAHSPEIVEEAAMSGIQLYLCGHTHGGQICLPGLGPLITNANCRRRYARGAWEAGEMRGFTNRGVGSSGVPVRFNCPPEIAILELQSRQAVNEGHPASAEDVAVALRP